MKMGVLSLTKNEERVLQMILLEAMQPENMLNLKPTVVRNVERIYAKIYYKKQVK
jgi:hypothetical protein